MRGIHEHILDFEILETGNPKTFTFVDSSVYYEAPDRPLLEITLPGYNKYLMVNISPKQVNVFNAFTLGLNQVFNQYDTVDLPDGVYQLKFKICPYKYIYIVKKHMRVTALLNKMSVLHSKIDLEVCKTDDISILKSLNQIYVLIEASKSVVNIDSNKAVRYYKDAENLIDKLLCKYC